MRLVILGSSSAGNCYLFDSGAECLVVECGMPFRDVQRAVSYDIRRLVGCLISHEHGDHCRSWRQLANARIPLYCSRGTAVAAGIDERVATFLIPLSSIAIGSFRVLPFAVQHDAAEPLGFIIYHPLCGVTLFATDTYYLRNTFAGLNNILLECNYRGDLLEENYERGIISETRYIRTVQSHMSYDTCLATLRANDLSQVNNIVLLHLSSDNSAATAFQRGIASATGKTVTVADKGVVIEEFHKTPY